MINQLKQTQTQLNNPFLALRHRNYQYYWFGMCISLIGTWMQNIAQPWLAYSLTKSPLMLSLVGALQFTPMLLFSLFAGVLIDKYPKKQILFLTQSAFLGITLILAILVWLEKVQFWHILFCATAFGLVHTLDQPARQALMVELVGKEDLRNAIALNSSIFNLARIIGPAIAGLVMAQSGVAVCFFANALSFAAFIGGLCLIKPLTTQAEPKVQKHICANIKDGLVYISRNEPLWRTVLTTAIVCTFSMNHNVLVPVLAKLELGQQGTGFGFLMSYMGVGSFIGAMVIAMLSKAGPVNLIMKGMPFLIGAFLIMTGFAHVYLLAGLGLAACGFCFVVFVATANSTMQLNAEDQYRGRVMSVYTLVFGGSAPIGNLYAGFVTNRFGPRIGFAACGGVIILLCLLLRLVGRENANRKRQRE